MESAEHSAPATAGLVHTRLFAAIVGTVFAADQVTKLIAADRLQRSATTLGEARRSAQAAEFAYANGALGIMDLLDARRNLMALQIESAQIRADHAKALAIANEGLAIHPNQLELVAEKLALESMGPFAETAFLPQ